MTGIGSRNKVVSKARFFRPGDSVEQFRARFDHEGKIYASLKAVPAWNSWATPLQFFATACVLGALLVAVAFVVSREATRAKAGQVSAVEGYEPGEGFFSKWINGAPRGAKRAWYQRVTADAEGKDDAAKADQLLAEALRFCVVVSAIGAAVIIVAIPVYVSGLAAAGGAAAASAKVYSSGAAIIRFALLAVGILLLTVMAYSRAHTIHESNTWLMWAVVGAFVLIFAGELIGRELFYDAMIRVGI